MSDTLPFTIRARLSGSDLAIFVAVLDGAAVAMERYHVGSGNRRREVAALWAEHHRLRNGAAIDPALVERELESAELRAVQALDAADAQVETDAMQVEDDGEGEGDGEGGRVVSVAHYVDRRQIVELAWNCDDGGPDLISFDRDSGTVTRGVRVESSFGTLVPPDGCGGIVTPGGRISGCVLLPAEYDESGIDETSLRADLMAFFGKYVELGDAVRLAAEYVQLTWVHDCFAELPYLAFRTPDAGCGKSRALTVAGSICYRPCIAGGGSTSAALIRLLDTFRPTLVCDEFNMRRNTDLASEVSKILCQGFEVSRPLVRCVGDANCPKPFNVFGCKMFALRQRFDDDAVESRIISIRMRPRGRGSRVPINLPREQFEREALVLRNRLLAWRFAKFGTVHVNPAHAESTLSDRANQVGLPLMAVAGEQGRARIVAALRQQESTVAESRGDTLAGDVLRCALTLCGVGGIVRPSAVSNELNRLRAVAEGIAVDRLKDPVKPWTVGRILSGELEFPRAGRDGEGVKYTLDAGRVAELRSRFGLSDTYDAPHPSGNPTLATHPTPSPEPTPKTDPFGVENGEGVGCVGLAGDSVPLGEPTPQAEQGDVPDGWAAATAADDSGWREREAVMAVEAGAELVEEVRAPVNGRVLLAAERAVPVEGGGT